MLFNLLSDLHLEHSRCLKGYKKFVFPKTAPNLLLAGDIGRIQDHEQMKTFLENASDAYQHVFFILGNHEGFRAIPDRPSYWNAAVTGARLLAERFDNIHFLNNDAYELTDEDGTKIVILGTPLHSHIPPDAADVVTNSMNDFFEITDWTVELHNTEHEKAKLFLSEITDMYTKADPNCKMVGLFHHAPLNKNVSAPQYEAQKDRHLNSAFATDLSSEAWFQKNAYRRFWTHPLEFRSNRKHEKWTCSSSDHKSKRL